MTDSSTWSQMTLITALVNINRQQVDGRTFQDYVNWFCQTIQIPAPMVIYAEPMLEEIVKEIRKELPTKFIPTNFANLPLAWSYDLVTSIQQSSEFQKKMKKPQDLANRLAGYPIVTNSKFAWIWNVLQENPFHTDLFFWIDGGLSRFWKFINPVKMGPHPDLLKILRETNKIYTQVGGYHEQIIFNTLNGNKLAEDDIIGANPSYLMAGFFGGTKDVLLNLCEESLCNYVKEMLQKRRIDHDQALLYWHFANHIDKYILIPPHPTLDVFNFLLFASGHSLV